MKRAAINISINRRRITMDLAKGGLEFRPQRANKHRIYCAVSGLFNYFGISPRFICKNRENQTCNVEENLHNE